jgi:hypothetical protein
MPRPKRSMTRRMGCSSRRKRRRTFDGFLRTKRRWAGHGGARKGLQRGLRVGGAQTGRRRCGPNG